MSIRNGTGLSQAANKTVEQEETVKRNRKIKLQQGTALETKKAIYRACGRQSTLSAS